MPGFAVLAGMEMGVAVGVIEATGRPAQGLLNEIAEGGPGWRSVLLCGRIAGALRRRRIGLTMIRDKVPDKLLLVMGMVRALDAQRRGRCLSYGRNLQRLRRLSELFRRVTLDRSDLVVPRCRFACFYQLWFFSNLRRRPSPRGGQIGFRSGD